MNSSNLLKNITQKCMKNFGNKFIVLALLSLFFHTTTKAEDVPKPYIIGNLQGQAGNHFFQIAATCALAWNNDAQAFFPQLASIPSEFRHYFSRCKIAPPNQEISYEWTEPEFRYHSIPYQRNMKLNGYFQSWKYFEGYRDQLLTLFAPTKRDLHYIQKKYASLLNNKNTVGIQLRYYFEDPYTYPQYGKDFLEKAMALFPETSTFVVSSNRIEFAKSQISPEGRTIIFLENEPSYIDFYLLTLCQHNIISNSTYGWWSAFLNTNLDQIVVCPSYWSAYDTEDLCPNNWIKVTAERIDPLLVN